nr:hypothetical protein [Mesorhizobium japonicum]
MFENIVSQLRRQRPGKASGSRSLYVVLHRTAGNPKHGANVANAYAVRV